MTGDTDYYKILLAAPSWSMWPMFPQPDCRRGSRSMIRRPKVASAISQNGASAFFLGLPRDIFSVSQQATSTARPTWSPIKSWRPAQQGVVPCRSMNKSAFTTDGLHGFTFTLSRGDGQNPLHPGKMRIPAVGNQCRPVVDTQDCLNSIRVYRRHLSGGRLYASGDAR